MKAQATQKVKPQTTTRTTGKTAVKSAPRKTKTPVPHKTGSGVKDSALIGRHNPHQAEFDLGDELKKWALGRSPQKKAPDIVQKSGGELQGPPTTSRVNGTDLPAAGKGTPTARVSDVPTGKAPRVADEWALYMMEVQKHMDKGGEAGGDVAEAVKQPKKFPKGRTADPKPMSVENPAGNNIDRTSKPKKGVPAESVPKKSGNPADFDLPKRSGPSFLERFQNSRLLAGVGLANSVNIARDGVNDLANGNYVEGGLKVAGGTLETYNNASDLHTAHQAAKTYKASQQAGGRLAEETVEQGFKGAKIAGKAAGGLMALYDGKQAYDAFKSGDEVKGTEHAMDTAWDVAGFSGVGTAGAVAHSLTRLAMSHKFNGVSGDDIVTGRLDSMMNSGVNQEASGNASHDRAALNSFRQIGEGTNLHAAANNKKDFAHAITGLLDEISKTEDAGKKRRLQAELMDMRQVQRRVREYNRT